MTIPQFYKTELRAKRCRRLGGWLAPLDYTSDSIQRINGDSMIDFALHGAKDTVAEALGHREFVMTRLRESA